jgi:hypothetical protein
MRKEAAVECPNCTNPMVALPLKTTLDVPVQANQCADCALLWFDAGSSVRLSAPSVLTVFQAIGTAKRAGAGAALRTAFSCPRCQHELALTHDLQRSTRFTYWRCPTDRGQLIGFTQFLLEKNFIRAPSADELARLRQNIREISCSQCGAPIDLHRDSMCPYCHAPIALVDPEGIASAVRDLRAHKGAPDGWSFTTSPSASTIGETQFRAIFDSRRAEQAGDAHDLLKVGIGAILAMLDDAL